LLGGRRGGGLSRAAKNSREGVNLMIEVGKHTTEEAMAALSMTVEEIEEMEANPEKYRRDEDLPPSIGKYGSLFLEFLKENYPGRHATLTLEMVLRDVCAEVNEEALDMMETVTSQLRAKTPRPKGDFMATVQYETAIRDRAEEFVLREIVYRYR